MLQNLQTQFNRCLITVRYPFLIIFIYVSLTKKYSMLTKCLIVFLLFSSAFISSSRAQCVTTISYIKDVKVMEDENKIRIMGERISDDYYVADFDLDNGKLIFSGNVGQTNFSKPYSNPKKNDISITDDGTYEIVSYILPSLGAGETGRFARVAVSGR